MSSNGDEKVAESNEPRLLSVDVHYGVWENGSKGTKIIAQVLGEFDETDPHKVVQDIAVLLLKEVNTLRVAAMSVPQADGDQRVEQPFDKAKLDELLKGLLGGSTN